MKWDDIATRLPGRSSLSCRLRYQNYLEKRAIWDEEKKNKLAMLYFRYVPLDHCGCSDCFILVIHFFILRPHLWFQMEPSTICRIRLRRVSACILKHNTDPCVRFKEEMWHKVAIQMGIPWRSAESMHWQLGEQEMSARANAPVFQLHPSATGTGMSSRSQVPMIPASALYGFTPANAPQLMPNPPPMPPQLHQMPQGPPMHGYGHQRTDSGSSAGGRRRRNSSFSRRRPDPRSRSNVPPQLGQPLPQIEPQSEEDRVSGTRTATVPGMQPIIKREGEVSSYTRFTTREDRKKTLQARHNRNTIHGARAWRVLTECRRAAQLEASRA
jgi:hypothetical protein